MQANPRQPCHFPPVQNVPFSPMDHMQGPPRGQGPRMDMYTNHSPRHMNSFGHHGNNVWSSRHGCGPRNEMGRFPGNANHRFPYGRPNMQANDLNFRGPRPPCGYRSDTPNQPNFRQYRPVGQKWHGNVPPNQSPRHNFDKNKNFDRNKKQTKPARKNKPKKKADECPYGCDICDRGFKTEEKYLEHCDGHVKCDVDGCQYVAAAKLVKLHYDYQHRTGLAKKIWKLQSKEEIEKWREERKKNFPTRDNIEKKKKELQDRIDRGEVIETKDFGRMRGRGRGRGRGGRNNRGGKGHNQRDKFQRQDIMSPENSRSEGQNHVAVGSKRKAVCDKQNESKSNIQAKEESEIKTLQSPEKKRKLDDTSKTRDPHQDPLSYVVPEEEPDSDSDSSDDSSESDSGPEEQSVSNPETSVSQANKTQTANASENSAKLLQQEEVKTEKKPLGALASLCVYSDSEEGEISSGDESAESANSASHGTKESSAKITPPKQLSCNNPCLDINMNSGPQIPLKMMDTRSQGNVSGQNLIAKEKTDNSQILVDETDGSLKNDNDTVSQINNIIDAFLPNEKTLSASAKNAQNHEDNEEEYDEAEEMDRKPENGNQRGRNQRRNRSRKGRKQQASNHSSVPVNNSTLLQKLLAGEIRHERNVIMQCIRHIVNKKFFDLEK